MQYSAEERHTNTVLNSFDLVIGSEPRLLILGSMPGDRSLQACQYYAHPRNAFWSIWSDLLGFDVSLSYPQRLSVLQQARIGLWDVVGQCQRQGSLDANIQSESVRVNDLLGCLRRYPTIQAIAFNGQASYKLFRKHLYADLQRFQSSENRMLALLSLPSTSPAYAAMKFEEKREQWRCLLQYLRETDFHS